MSDKKKLTTNAGCPVVDNQNVMTAGPRGPQLLQDVWYLEKLGHFDREVIRAAHARQGLRRLRKEPKMLFRNLLRCVVAFAVATPMYALADSLNAKTGAWEITATSLTTGMPIPAEALAKMPPEQRANIEKTMRARAGKPSTHVRKSCVTQNKLDEDRIIKSDDEGQCKKKIISKSANKIVFERTCPAPSASTSNVTIEARTPESIVASMDMMRGGAGGKIHVDIKGRWLGASCAGIKEGS